MRCKLHDVSQSISSWKSARSMPIFYQNVNSSPISSPIWRWLHCQFDVDYVILFEYRPDPWSCACPSILHHYLAIYEKMRWGQGSGPPSSCRFLGRRCYLSRMEMVLGQSCDQNRPRRRYFGLIWHHTVTRDRSNNVYSTSSRSKSILTMRAASQMLGAWGSDLRHKLKKNSDRILHGEEGSKIWGLTSEGRTDSDKVGSGKVSFYKQ